MCYKKTNAAQAVLLYKEVVSIHIDLGRFNSAAKVQKEIGELYEAEGDTNQAMDAYQTAADYYQAEESNSTANQVHARAYICPRRCKSPIPQVLSRQTHPTCRC